MGEETKLQGALSAEGRPDTWSQAGVSRPADAPRPPHMRDARADGTVQGALDALEGVAFIEGDANVEAVGEIAPGRHRAALLGYAIDLGKILLAVAIGLVGVVVGLFDGETDLAAKAGAAGVLAAVVAACVAFVAVEWRMTTWELADDGLVLRSGLFVRKQRRIPYQRVHSVDLSATVLQRLFGLASVAVDTGAGGTSNEKAVKYIRRTEGEALKRALFARRVLVEKGDAAQLGVAGIAATEAACAAGVADEAAARIAVDPTADIAYEMHLPHRLHLVAAATDFSVAAALGSVLLAGFGLFQTVFELFGNRFAEQVAYLIVDAVEGVTERAIAESVPAFLPLAAVGVSVGLVAAFAVGWLVSTVLAYIRWGGFVLRRRGERVEVSCGLLSRSTRAVELNRVQSVVVDQSPLRRMAGYVQVAVRVVGSAVAENGSHDRERVVLHPCLRRGEVSTFLGEVLPEFAEVASMPVEQLGLHRLPGAALRRTLLRGAYWTAAIAVLVGVPVWLMRRFPPADATLLGVFAVLAAFALVFAVFCCAAMFIVRVLAWRIRRIGASGPVLVTVDGGLCRRVTYLARAKAQSMTRRVTPFQARANVATVSLATACMSHDGDPKMRDVGAPVAADLMAWVRPHYDNADEAHGALREAGLA